MKKKMLAIAVMFLTGSLFMPDTTFAAWTQQKGHSYQQLTFSYYSTDERFSTVRSTVIKEVETITGLGGTERESQTKYEAYSLTYYGELGITDTLTILATVPWKRFTSKSDTPGTSGIGDIELGLRYNLSKNLFGSDLLMSLQGIVKIPEAYKYGSINLNSSLGEGQYDTTLAVLFGKGFNKGYAWLNVGYNYRFENNKNDPLVFKPSDQVKILIGGGYNITPLVTLRGFLDWTTSVGNASLSRELIGSSFFAVESDALREHVLIRKNIGLEPSFLNVWVDLVVRITPNMQAFLTYSRDVAGRDSSIGQTYGTGLIYIY